MTRTEQQTDKQEADKSLPLVTQHGVNMAAWQRLPVHDEQLSDPQGLDRREALKLMGASAALALGAPGCKRKPVREIVARAQMPEYQKPGKALEYASTWTEGGFPYGMLVKVVDNRPVKIEGNPDHPVNRESSSAQMQASILGLYDPDRLRAPKIDGHETDWHTVDKKVIDGLRAAERVVLLTRSTLGPSERALVQDFLAAKPGVRHLVFESVHDSPRRKAWRQIFGTDGEWVADFSKAETIISIDCDFLGTDGQELEASGQYVSRRNPEETRGKMSRLWAIESTMTATGSNADMRIRLKPSQMKKLVLAIGAGVGGSMEAADELIGKLPLDQAWVHALIEECKVNRGRVVVVAGGHLSASTHAAVAMLNDWLLAGEQILTWNPMPASLPVNSIAEIRAAIQSKPDVLLCLGVNPLHGIPTLTTEDFNGIGLTVGHDLYETETLSACKLALASHHNLESWNDAVARHGQESLCQPALHPLWNTRQDAESLLKWTQAIATNRSIARHQDWHDYVRSSWMRRHYPGAVASILQWQESLRKGVAVKNMAVQKPALDRGNAMLLVREEPVPHSEGYELVIWPDAKVLDGRFANSTWLQELPDPVTRIVWDNAALMSQKTADELGVSIGDYDKGDVDGDQIRLTVDDREVILPVMVVPGMAEGVLAVNAGYGRTAGGVVGKNVGFNPMALLRDASEGRTVMGVQVQKASGRYPLVRTQKTMTMRDPTKEKRDRPIALDGTLEQFESYQESHSKKPFVDHMHMRHLPKEVDFYKGHDYSHGPRWHMVVDMNKCTGCSGCVTACQAENNIPVVGKQECANGREMSWIRIDRYHSDEMDDPRVHSQPMLCQHCENAPCENVCPVNATSHSPDGLNDMAYNRCIGTRYCQNNCPYKVRRFNYYDYTNGSQPAAPRPKGKGDAEGRTKLQLVNNPQVTVRMRGIMEKCSFCVQRLNAAKFAAKNAGRDIRDGDVKVACQQACPTGAIRFGNINDATSDVSRGTKSPLAYHVLEELNVRPSVTYFARIRNPHPVAAPAVPEGHHGDHDDTHHDDHGESHSGEHG